jgi:hypothetical protein
MRSFSAWLNMSATFCVLGSFYTGLNVLTNGSIDPITNIYYTFILLAVILAASINSMLYINTLHKDIEELTKKNKNTIKIDNNTETVET